MNRRSLRVITLIAAICQATALLAQSSPDTLATEFEDYFYRHVSEENVTGAAFVITTPQRIIRTATAGHTDTSRQHRVNENTVFRVASVSKTFAAGLAGLLVNEGAFRWEDRVVDYVPGFHIKGDASRLRVEDVVGQSTGLIPHAYDNLIEDGLTMDRITEKFGALSYICEPQRCYSYQNSVFSLIETVIENTTAREYGQLMEERIFLPLDMKNASVGYDAFVNSPDRALPHVKVRDGWATVRVKKNYYNVAPAAGVNASALDMGKWLMANMGARPDVIDPAVIRRLTEPRVTTARDKRRKYWRDVLSEAHYGLGWRIYEMGNHRIVYHSGWVSGYRADLAWSEEHGIGMAVLMNVESGAINELTTTFWQMAFDSLPLTGKEPRIAALAASP